MPSLTALTELYANFMLNPRAGEAVCEICFDLTDGHRRCYGCSHNSGWLDAVVPISYSVAHEQLHHALAGYKRQSGRIGERFQIELGAVIWRFLDGHEPCLARAAETPTFDVVTTVPSSRGDRDLEHPLRRIVGDLVEPTRGRYEPVLAPGPESGAHRQFSLARYQATRPLDGQSILLVDDTWTTGSSARSAAATLKRAGAERVAALVIGRHLHRDYRDNDLRLRALPRPFDWSACALQSPAAV
jgi:hypothetical protein